MIDSIAAHILGLPAWVALLVVFALPALESSAFVGFVFPGEIALILGGVLASESRVPLAAVLVAGIGGAVVGDSVGYLVGRRYGRRLLEGTLGRFIRHDHFDRAERYLAERGGKAVFLGRFTAALRVMIPGLAGMSHMPYRKFAVMNVAGGVVWGTLVVLLGYLGGSSWRHVAHLTSRIGLAALGLVVVVLLGAWVLRRSLANGSASWADRTRESRVGSTVAARFPRGTAWLGSRLSQGRPQGLHLTTAVVLLVAATWIFLGMTQDVLAHDGLASVDPRLHAWILQHRSGPLTTIMEIATVCGSNLVVLPALLVTALVLRRTRDSWRPAASIAVVYGLAQVIHAVVGVLVHRARPPAQDWLAAASGWSYPSGHTLQAATASGILLVLLAPPRTKSTRIAMGVAAVAFTLLVAASRVYLGMHWLSDVLASIAAALALLGASVATRLVTAGARNLPRKPTDTADSRVRSDVGETLRQW